jgi:hypothetical protein
MASAFAFRLVPAQPDIAQKTCIEFPKSSALPLPVPPLREPAKRVCDAIGLRRPGECRNSDHAEQD